MYQQCWTAVFTTNVKTPRMVFIPPADFDNLWWDLVAQQQFVLCHPWGAVDNHLPPPPPPQTQSIPWPLSGVCHLVYLGKQTYSVVYAVDGHGGIDGS